MPAKPQQQRTIYRGVPARAWLAIELHSPSGDKLELQVVVDTGNPCGLIVSSSVLAEYRWRESPGTDSNFGSMEGGWLRLIIPEITFDEKINAYSSDTIVSVVERSDAGFQGLIGLPLLRMLTYGGNAGYFWVE